MPLEALPPFELPGETIEEAVQQELNLIERVKLIGRQVVQLSERQDTLQRNFISMAGDVGRMVDAQTVCNGMMQLFLMRQKKIMEHDKVPDVDEAEEIEASLLARMK